MKKKLFFLFCLLTTGILTWQLWPEYDSGYSEVQRRLWNERRQIYPVEWMVSSPFSSRGGNSDLSFIISAFIGLDDKATKLLIEEKEKQEQELDKELQKNRDLEGVEYKVAPPLHPNISRLPLEGLTEKEVAERALAGDGDACLRMVQYLCDDDLDGKSLSWRKYHELERWLGRAVDLKRPGSEFLKNFFHEEIKYQKSQISTIRIITLRSAWNMENIPGYADYLACLKKGDTLLHGSVVAICPEFRPRSYHVIRDVLRKEANLGKKESQRKFASLCFENVSFKQKHVVRSGIDEDILDKEKEWNKLLKGVPGTWRSSFISGLFSCGIIDAGRTRTMDWYREAADCARKAARQGDLTGMYLWMKYGLKSLKRFSRADWEEIFVYDRVLIEAGYAPYMQRDWDELSNTVLQSYYSGKSYWKIRKNDYLADRGEVYKYDQNPIGGEVISKDNRDETRIKVENYQLTGQTDYLLRHLKYWQEDGTVIQAGEEVRNYLLEQVEKWAMEGDLHAMYVLAEFYEEGRFITADLGRAYALYEEILEKAGEFSFFQVLVSRVEYAKDGNREFSYLNYAALLGMAEMVLKYPEFPGRNEKKIYDRLEKFVSLRYNCNYGYGNYLLGQFCERGIGCTADRKKALEVYKRSSHSSNACRKAEKQLSASLKKEGKVEKKKEQDEN